MINIFNTNQEVILTNFINFKKEFVEFFDKLSKNNNKDWFDENRDFYKKNIRKTAKDFVEAMNIVFTTNGLSYIADSKKSLFRINRDIRFSKNKEPYKTNFGAFFPYSLEEASKKKTEAFGLYFHLDPQQTFVAGGLHMPDNETLNKFRKYLENDYQNYLDIVENEQFQIEFQEKVNMTPPLKNPPRGFSKDHPAIELLKQKEFSYFCGLVFDDIYSENFLDTMLRKAIALNPLMDYFHKAIHDKG